jgi:hypothetical protein
MMFTQGWAVKALAAVGVRASNALVTTGPGVAGLGPVPTLLTGMYAVAGVRHVRSKSLVSGVILGIKQSLIGLLGSVHERQSLLDGLLPRDRHL